MLQLKRTNVGIALVANPQVLFVVFSAKLHCTVSTV